MKRICIVGAGFSGAVYARAFSEAGWGVLVLDERPHIAGNCHSERDSETGVMVHKYGPHIFHTDKEHVWNFIRRFGEMAPYVNRVKATVGGRVYSLPINLLTINQFFGTALGPRDAKAFLESKARLEIGDPQNFEEQALRFVGPELYEAFFRGYTKKQWGCDPKHLPASILKRLPIRFNYDDNYFAHPYQGMPVRGYTHIVSNILNAPGVEVRTACRYEDVAESFEHTFYSGPLDRFFEFRLGRLGYRTLEFERFVAPSDFQGTAVMNYCDEGVPYTRIAEHMHFAPWERTEGASVCFREFSRDCGKGDTPYYPTRHAGENALLKDYVAIAETQKAVTFIGRLGTYRYLDMDACIDEALRGSEHAIARMREGSPPPVFINSPL